MRYPIKSFHKITIAIVLLTITSLLASACGADEVTFAVKHLRDVTGQQISEVLSASDPQGAQLDNSNGSSPLQVQIDFQRNFKYQMAINLSDNEVSEKQVQNKIVELYKLPPNDPEGEEQTALCPISVVIPAGRKATVTIQWTERWAEGVVNKGTAGDGDQIGTYRVFLGYVEPCSLIKQDNN